MTQINIFKNQEKRTISGRKVARLMGTKVVVYEELTRRAHYPGAVRDWERVSLVEPRSGWLFGVRRVYDGVVERDGWEYPNVFYQTRSHPVLLVAYWPMEKPVHVPPDEGCVRLWEEGDQDPFSSAFGASTEQRANNVKLLKEAMDQGFCPRDEKGRFRELTTEEYYAAVEKQKQG